MNRAIPLQTAPGVNPWRRPRRAALRLVGQGAGQIRPSSPLTTPDDALLLRLPSNVVRNTFSVLGLRSRQEACLNRNKESPHVWHSLHSGCSQ